MLPKVTCLSIFPLCAKTALVAKHEDSPALQIEQPGLTSLAPLMVPPPPSMNYVS